MGRIKEKLVQFADMAEEIMDAGVSEQELDDFMQGELSPEDFEMYHSHKNVVFGLLGLDDEEDDDEEPYSPPQRKPNGISGPAERNPFFGGYKNMDESIMMKRMNEDSFDEADYLAGEDSFEDYEDEDMSDNYPRAEDGNILEYETWIIDELVDSGISEEEAIILVDKHRDIISGCFTLDGDASECAMNILDVEKTNESLIMPSLKEGCNCGGGKKRPLLIRRPKIRK